MSAELQTTGPTAAAALPSHPPIEVKRMINRVTITGADDGTDPRDMVALSKEYPFVEWAVLVSKSREGTARYPTRAWSKKLVGCITSENIAMHVCGAWARLAFNEALTLSELPSVRHIAERIQINGKAPYNTPPLDRLHWAGAQFILQAPASVELAVKMKQAGVDVAILFDQSGGAGKQPSKLSQPWKDWYCGWAGGIGPDNARATVEGIMAINPGQPFWIDMEGRVRDDKDRLDLYKVEEVLNYVKPLIGQS